MPLTVNTNITALQARRNLQPTKDSLGGSFERISSGLSITEAADDAAGLAVAENLDTEVRSMRQARQNIDDGISLIQTVEGATNEPMNVLKRIRELALRHYPKALPSQPVFEYPGVLDACCTHRPMTRT